MKDKRSNQKGCKVKGSKEKKRGKRERKKNAIVVIYTILHDLVTLCVDKYNN